MITLVKIFLKSVDKFKISIYNKHRKGKTLNGHAKSVMLRNNTSTLAQGRVIFLWLLLKAKELS